MAIAPTSVAGIVSSGAATAEPAGRRGAAAARPRSVHMLAAVDRQRRAGDETRLVGDEEEHAAGDLLGIAEPSDWDARDDLLEHIGRHGAHHLAVDICV